MSQIIQEELKSGAANDARTNGRRIEDVARNLDQREVDAALPKIVAWAETKVHRKS